MRRQSLAPLVVVPLLLAPHVGNGYGPPARELTILGTAAMCGGLRSGYGGCHHEYGGLARLSEWFDGIRRTESTVLTLDAGDFVPLDRGVLGARGGLPQARMMASMMGRLGYDAWTPGEFELAYGMDHLIEFSASLDGTVVSANLRDETGRPFLPAFRIRTVNGLRVGLTGITDPDVMTHCSPSEMARIGSDFRLDDPTAALTEVVDRMRPEVDVIVVLAHAVPERVRAILHEVRGVDLAIAGHEWRRGDLSDTTGAPIIVGLPGSGRSGHVISIDLDAMNRAGHVSVSATLLGTCGGRNPYPVNPDIARVIEAFERRQAAEHRLAVKEQSRANAARPFTAFLGADLCARCHAGIDTRWREGSHARAFESLIRVGRERDAECLPCHVTAWDEPGGFTRMTVDEFDVMRERQPDSRPELAGVQCEACHGQGTAHGTRRMVTQVSEDACRTCHDAANDPDFDYTKALAGGLHHE